MSTLISNNEIEKQYEYMARVRSLVADTGAVACIQTYGCQQNEADGERLCGMALEMGYMLTDNPADASLILVNTCAVREHAELKVLSITGQFKHLKEKNPNLMLGICGCMVSQEHRAEDIKNRYPYVDFLFGTPMLWRFPEILLRAMTEKKRVLCTDGDVGGNIAEGLPVKRASRFKAYVSIMYGCNNFCSYCVVPYVRGRERSRSRNDILNEIKGLAAEGYKEITLLGQNVNSYGKDTGENGDFADLLSDICKIDGDFLVRFMTSHPKDASRKLIDTIAANEKIAKQFHLPLQSGSDAVLRAMNRKYTVEGYLELVSYMREKMPDIALSTDIIVGFPGETEEDFSGTLDTLRKVRFNSIFSFIYSKRKGTPAAVMENQIPESVKSERFERLLELQNGISRNLNNLYENTVIRVLVEGRSKADAGKLTGRNEKNRLVHFESDNDLLIGSFVNVLVKKSETYALYGELVK